MKIERLTKSLSRRVKEGEWNSTSLLPSCALLSKEYGVSPATVSIAMRNLEKKGLVRIAPRKGVFVIEQGEQGAEPPSATATTIGLRGGYIPSETELLATDARQLFAHGLFNSIWQAAQRQECPLLLLPKGNSDQQLTPASCEKAGVRGVIFLGGDGYNEALQLRCAGHPVILANRPVGGTPVNFVDYDAPGELRQILQHLIGLGHQNIGVLCPARTSVPGYYPRLKLDYIDELLKHGLFKNPELYWKTTPDTPGALHTIVAEWLALPEPPTAIFSWTPHFIPEVRQALAEMAPKRLERLSLASSGHLEERDLELSGFLMPHRECGTALLEGLIASIKDPFLVIQRLVPCRFVDKGTLRRP